MATITTRRALLASAPAIAAAVALPAVASTPSPLRALYAEWQEAKTLYNTDDRYAAESKAGEDLFTTVAAMETRAAEYDPQSVEDFAWKIIFADDDGDMNQSTAQHALVDLAYAMVGIAPGRWFRRANWGVPVCVLSSREA